MEDFFFFIQNLWRVLQKEAKDESFNLIRTRVYFLSWKIKC